MRDPSHPRSRAWLGATLAVTLVLALTAPTVAAAERPKSWTCDDSGQLVCAGADAGAQISCDLTRTSDSSADARCSWTYGQLMGGASPLGLPGEAVFAWSATIRVCHTTADLQPISCDSTTPAGDATCSWAPLQECIESQGPNPGQTDVTVIETGECLLVEIETSATAQAWTPTQGDELADAAHTGTGSNAGAACLQNNGR